MSGIRENRKNKTLKKTIITKDINKHIRTYYIYKRIKSVID